MINSEKTKNLQALQTEIDYLQKCESYLHRIMFYFKPYDDKINGVYCDNLIRELYEFLYDFDDSA